MSGVHRSEWAEFVRWCVERGEAALPASPASIVDHLAERAPSFRVAAAERVLVGIDNAHRDVGLTSPTDDARVRIEMTRLRWRQRQSRGRTVPLAVRELRAMVASLPGGLIGARDHALLLVGAGAGLRPSEVVALDVSDLVVVDDGLSVALLRGRIVVPYEDDDGLCAPRSWQTWVAAAGLTAGPAFRAVDRRGRLGVNRLSETSVTRIVRRAAERAGLDAQRYSGRSLRLDAPA